MRKWVFGTTSVDQNSEFVLRWPVRRQRWGPSRPTDEASSAPSPVAAGRCSRPVALRLEFEFV